MPVLGNNCLVEVVRVGGGGGGGGLEHYRESFPVAGRHLEIMTRVL